MDNDVLDSILRQDLARHVFHIGRTYHRGFGDNAAVIFEIGRCVQGRRDRGSQGTIEASSGFIP
jgi:hypothetical protein